MPKNTRHILRKYNRIKQNVERRYIKMSRVPTDDNIADPLTKILPRAKHEQHVRSMGIREML